MRCRRGPPRRIVSPDRRAGVDATTGRSGGVGLTVVALSSPARSGPRVPLSRAGRRAGPDADTRRGSVPLGIELERTALLIFLAAVTVVIVLPALLEHAAAAFR